MKYLALSAAIALAPLIRAQQQEWAQCAYKFAFEFPKSVNYFLRWWY